ncbi:MAG: ABC transporter substrate-binding protein [Clostridia bacterium]|nr:ABC transporter substrate-binding protein [Clostridia bacterium]
MKKLISILLTLLLVLSFAGCGTKDTSSTPSTPEKLDTKVNIYGIAGPTGVGLANLMEKAEKGEGNLQYSIALAANNDEIVAKIKNGEADIAAVATNLASTLYNVTNGGVQVLAINTLGVLNVVTKGYEIDSIADLKGLTIYSTGQGANPEYIINDILKNNNLEVGKDVKIEFVAQPQELVVKMKTNEKAVVVAPQPVATNITNNVEGAKIVIDLNDEWDKFHDEALTMGCIIVRKEFAEKNPDAIKIFLKEYKASIEKTNSDIDGTAALCEKFKIIAPAAVAKKAIPNCNVFYQDGETMKTNLSAYLNFLFGLNPKSVGGKLPADDFYFGVK